MWGHAYLCNDGCRYSEQRADGEDDEGELPAFDEADDEASEEGGDRLDE